MNSGSSTERIIPYAYCNFRKIRMYANVHSILSYAYPRALLKINFPPQSTITNETIKYQYNVVEWQQTSYDRVESGVQVNRPTAWWSKAGHGAGAYCGGHLAAQLVTIIIRIYDDLQ